MTLPRLRLLSQIIFFALFLFFLRTEFLGSGLTASDDARLPYPVSIFLQADPLVSVSSALSAGALYKGLLWSLTIIIPTLFLGRIFCGWICPLGTLNHFFSNLKSERKQGKQRIESNRYKRWQTLKYYLLIALLVSALLGSQFLFILDPISLTVRSLGLSVLPGINYGLAAVLHWSYPGHGGTFAYVVWMLDSLLQGILVSARQPYFRQGFFLGIILITVLALNLRITRFWCRALCPLGALLGVLSRWSVLGLEKQAAKCGDCNRCLLHCQGGDDPIPGAKWRKAECHLCFNCVQDCPESGIKFKFFPGRGTTAEGPNLTRRRVITGAAAGAAALPLFRIMPGVARRPDPLLIRPPGALDETRFLDRCVRCGECMKACPNNALHPALAEAGLEGLWTPVLVARIGYCEPSCVLCSQVCPTGAIWEITAGEKGWDAARARPGAKPVRIGTAFYDRGRCLPWAMATECIVCEEWCPTSPKAIYLRTAEAADVAGNTKQVRQPYVDPDHCVGCGACEYACPVQDRPAIAVSSVGESRSRANQILLQVPRPEAGA